MDFTGAWLEFESGGRHFFIFFSRGLWWAPWTQPDPHANPTPNPRTLPQLTAGSQFVASTRSQDPGSTSLLGRAPRQAVRVEFVAGGAQDCRLARKPNPHEIPQNVSVRNSMGGPPPPSDLTWLSLQVPAGKPTMLLRLRMSCDSNSGVGSLACPKTTSLPLRERPECKGGTARRLRRGAQALQGENPRR